MPMTMGVERRYEVVRALDLRKRGYSQDSIARELGMTRKTVARRLEEGYREMHAQSAEEIRREIEYRYDQIVKNAWEMAEDDLAERSARLGALRMILQAEKARARLLGVEVPSRVVLEVEQRQHAYSAELEA